MIKLAAEGGVKGCTPFSARGSTYAYRLESLA